MPPNAPGDGQLPVVQVVARRARACGHPAASRRRRGSGRPARRARSPWRCASRRPTATMTTSQPDRRPSLETGRPAVIEPVDRDVGPSMAGRAGHAVRVGVDGRWTVAPSERACARRAGRRSGRGPRTRTSSPAAMCDLVLAVDDRVERLDERAALDRRGRVAAATTPPARSQSAGTAIEPRPSPRAGRSRGRVAVGHRFAVAGPAGPARPARGPGHDRDRGPDADLAACRWRSRPRPSRGRAPAGRAAAGCRGARSGRPSRRSRPRPRR